MNSVCSRWSCDAELFELHSAAIGDIFDLLGRRHQLLPPQIQRPRADFVLCGRAMTVLEADDAGGEGADRDDPALSGPFGLMLRALDDFKKGEV